MLLKVFLVLGACQGVMGSDDRICDFSLYQVCNTPDDWQFPKTEAGVDRLCQQVLGYFDCFDNYTAKCESANDYKDERLQKLRVLTEEACQKDSPLYLSTIQNIACIYEVVHNGMAACHEYLNKKGDIIANYLLNIEALEEHDDGVYDLPYHCLWRPLEIACFASKSSKRCGSEAEGIVVEFLIVGLAYRPCSESRERRLPELLAVLGIELGDASLNRIFGEN